ncbi:MAG: hypothetical protein IAF08_01415 [Rhizobacter sp.]|nr:hypothetical protein [Chlorobiales bacterium]
MPILTHPSLSAAVSKPQDAPKDLAPENILQLRFDHHGPVKSLLLLAALFHLAEFFICKFFFSQTSGPFFHPPVATAVAGQETFLYAHSIIRQYGTFALQLGLINFIVATNPPKFSRFVRLLVVIELCAAAFAFAQLWRSEVPAVAMWITGLWNLMIAAGLWLFAPKETLSLPSPAAERAAMGEFNLFGLRISGNVRYLVLKTSLLIVGLTWTLWAFGSTVFWQIGVAGISSTKGVEGDLVRAMGANDIVRNGQGLLLFAIGAVCLLASQRPAHFAAFVWFVMLQQGINFISAVIELSFGSIAWPQFFIVAGGQAAIALYFYLLLPRGEEQRLTQAAK